MDEMPTLDERNEGFIPPVFNAQGGTLGVTPILWQLRMAYPWNANIEEDRIDWDQCCTCHVFAISERDLFAQYPPTWVLPFCERVVMLRGRLIQSGAVDPFNPKDDGTLRRASTASSYCWIVWIKGQGDTRLRWLGKSRRQLEREGDYPAYDEQATAPAEGALL